MEDELIAFGTEVKALGGGKVGGYLVRFTDADTPDLTGDYFDAKTTITMPDSFPLLYNHGMDSTLKKRVIGKVTTKIDNVGVWADAQMNLRDEYEKAIYAMAEAGKLGYSSGALSHLVEREPAGKSAYIKTWFIGEASLTPTPAEYRNTVVTLKSLLPPDAALPDKDETKPTQSIVEKKKMDTDEIKAVKDAVKAELLAEQEAKAAKQAELEAAKTAGYQQAVEEMKGLNVPHYNSKTELGFSEEKDAVPAFKHWVSTGQVNQALIRPDASYTNIKAAWNIGDGATGGYLVPDPLHNQVIAKRNIASFVRIAPTQNFVTPADHYLVPTEDTSMTAFVETAESAAYNENEGNVGQTDIIIKKYTKEVRQTEEFLKYQGTNFDTWLMDALGRAEAKLENTTATTVLLAAAQASGITTASATAITIPELAATVGSLGGGYNQAGQVGWLMKNASLWYLKGVFGTNYYNFDGLMGMPAFISDDMGAVTSAQRSVLFGNWNLLGVAEKTGMMVQRDPYSRMGYGEVRIFANIFRGYAVLQAEAFKTLLQKT